LAGVRFPLFTLLALVLAAIVLALGQCGEDESAGTGQGSGPAASTTTATTTDGDATPRAVEPGEDGGEAPDDDPAAASPAPSDEELIEAAVIAVLAGKDPRRVCTSTLSERFLREAYGGLQGCLNGRDPASLARPGGTRVEPVRIDAGRAEVVAHPAGGTYGGERLEAVVVRSAGGWRVDELRADIPVGP
jgi:hypothetical protein